MGRRSYGGRSARAPTRAPARAPARAQASKPPTPVNPRAPGDGSILGAIGSTIAEGMAFGTGNAIAHRAVDSVMGPRTFKHETVSATDSASTPAAATINSFSDACGVHSKAFQDCINNSGNDISKCQFYMDMLSECKKSSGVAA